MKRELSYNTIGTCLRRRAEISPDQIAVLDKENTYTWRQLNQISDGLAFYFLSIGIKKGIHAGIYCANSFSWIAVYMGLQKIGAIAVLLNPGCIQEELEETIQYADISYFFYGNSYKNNNLKEILFAATKKKQYNVDNLIGIELPDFLKKIQDILKAPQIMKEKDAEEITSNDIACMLFTSGTTSSPKGVILSHSNVVNCAIATAEAMHWQIEDKICVMVPLFHCFGMTSCMLASVMVGSTLCLISRYRTVAALELIQKYKCTVLNGVPSMFLAMLHNPELNNYDLHSLESGIIAGSTIKPEDYMEISNRLHINHLQMSFGQTETSPGVSFSGYEQSLEEKSDNAGVAIPGIQLCIWDKNGTQYIYPSTVLSQYCVEGELGVKGYIVMQEYYNMPEETEKALQKDGWLHTGDKAWMDEKNQIHIIGRIKDIIIRGGENINPEEIEMCIMGIPEVKEVKVVGVSHPILQEEIAAMVVLKDEKELTVDKIKDYVKEHLANYKVPAYVKIDSHLPKSASGKIKTCEVREQMEEYKKRI